MPGSQQREQLDNHLTKWVTTAGRARSDLKGAWLQRPLKFDRVADDSMIRPRLDGLCPEVANSSGAL